ncbi:DUF4136 domain-containing protein [Ramlibacter sp. AN1015]|uniref:DUF4136 domain-containing protein n=1 Tax=Ramlibacter sp. AN1015 TaxID=3133428 RepID=UPI0030C19531
MTRAFSRWAGLLVLASAAFVSGCATGYRVDAAVQSYSALQGLPASPTYRFEWLPSQRGPEQAQLAALADQALFQAGLRRDDASPRFAVQVDVSGQRILSPWADPWYGGWGGWGGGWGLGVGANRGIGIGLGFGAPFFPRPEPPWYHREVRVLVRDLSANQVVYESRAVNEGPWADSGAVLSAMFQAAMQGFPNPPQGVRRVDVQIGQAR